jgi:hypothetical protein
MALGGKEPKCWARYRQACTAAKRAALEGDAFEPDELEPLPGVGPMTGALEAFAHFFNIDRDLVADEE